MDDEEASCTVCGAQDSVAEAFDTRRDRVVWVCTYGTCAGPHHIF